MTAFYSVLHMFVDGVCAFAMFGNFLRQEQGYLYILLYDFCAFALQMPFGAALDMARHRGVKETSLLTAAAGVVLTLAGTVTHPVLLGIGNALFHVGGGVGTIWEDDRKGWRGRGLGVFVAPGALGLYLGTQLAGSGADPRWLWGVGLLMTMACACACYRILRGGLRTSAVTATGDRTTDSIATDTAAAGDTPTDMTGSVPADAPIRVFPLAACLFLVVVLRSYIGMAVTFPWKTTALAASLSVLAVALGKAAGGFAAARSGSLKTAVLSLSAAAVLYLFSGSAPAGIAALFLFNMTMPITLYLLIRRFPRRPGLSFGLLTFGLFIGFLPEYFGLRARLNYSIIGSVGSLVSLFLLTAGIVWARIGGWRDD